MEATTLEWKAAGFGPRFRIGITDSSMTITRRGRTTHIPFERIATVYVSHFGMPPAGHMVRLEIVDTQGHGFDFHASGFGMPDANFATCRRAASTLLRRLADRPSNIVFHEGVRPGQWSRLLVAYLYLVVTAGALGAAVHLFFGRPEDAVALALVLSLCFLFGIVWTGIRSHTLPEVAPDALAERVEGL